MDTENFSDHFGMMTSSSEDDRHGPEVVADEEAIKEHNGGP